jgi:hypothetical protein
VFAQDSIVRLARKSRRPLRIHRHIRAKRNETFGPHLENQNGFDNKPFQTRLVEPANPLTPQAVEAGLELVR